MKRLELSAVEHGLAALAAFGLATVAQVAVVASQTPLFPATRSNLAWCLSDAIPTAVALALVARGRRALVSAAVAGVLVELVALGSCMGLTAVDGLGASRPPRLHDVFVDVVGSFYGSHQAVICAVLGRTVALFLAARAKGTLLEGLALGGTLGFAWCAMQGFEPRGLVGPLAFALGVTVLLPLSERATVKAFESLGVSDRSEPPG